MSFTGDLMVVEGAIVAFLNACEEYWTDYPANATAPNLLLLINDGLNLTTAENALVYEVHVAGLAVVQRCGV